MGPGPITRLRALILLVTLVAGVGTQAVAACATTMALPYDAGLAASTDASGGCPGCAGNDPSSAEKLTCVAAFCCLSPAILAQGAVVKPVPDATFPSVPAETVEG